MLQALQSLPHLWSLPHYRLYRPYSSYRPYHIYGLYNDTGSTGSTGLYCVTKLPEAHYRCPTAATVSTSVGDQTQGLLMHPTPASSHAFSQCVTHSPRPRSPTHGRESDSHPAAQRQLGATTSMFPSRPHKPPGVHRSACRTRVRLGRLHTGHSQMISDAFHSTSMHRRSPLFPVTRGPRTGDSPFFSGEKK